MSDLTDYLNTIVEFHGQHRTKPEGWKYGSYEELVLAEGTEFLTDFRLQKNGPVKECYSNSLLLALEEGWTYCEGFALSSIGFPVMHAWCVDDDGNVVETTWENLGTEYIGIELEARWVMEQTVETGYYGLLANDWLNNNSALKDGLQDD